MALMEESERMVGPLGGLENVLFCVEDDTQEQCGVAKACFLTRRIPKPKARKAYRRAILTVFKLATRFFQTRAPLKLKQNEKES